MKRHRANLVPSWQITLMFASLVCSTAQAELTLSKSSLGLSAGTAEQFQFKNAKSNDVKWFSDDPKVAQIFQNGFVIALRAGSTKVRAQQTASTAECTV